MIKYCVKVNGKFFFNRTNFHVIFKLFNFKNLLKILDIRNHQSFPNIFSFLNFQKIKASIFIY
jgi:hypothetical protein